MMDGESGEQKGGLR